MVSLAGLYCGVLNSLHPICACTDRCTLEDVSVLVRLGISDRSWLSNVPFDLIDKGKISAIKVQLTGPIPYAKLAMSIEGQS
jgi:hypothetical protein